jgi:2-hydroxycyclohexanecarboxyl-CoA dehydrogenase
VGEADRDQPARDPAKLIEAFRSAIPLGRLGQPDDLASAIVFFGSDDAGFITGQVISVSGGLTMHG